MYVVSRVYDDDSADIAELGSIVVRRYTFFQLANEVDKHIEGVTVYNKQLLDVRAKNIMSFPTEQEAIEYKGSDPGTIMYLQGYWWLINDNPSITHVDYYVCTQVGDEITYVSNYGYTPYIQAAKSFTEAEAIKSARAMTKHSKTGKYWEVKRVVR